MHSLTSDPLLASAVDVEKFNFLLERAPPAVQSQLKTYAEEKLFFRRVLDHEVRQLAPGSRVVEIGSGIGLLASLIAAEGHSVVAYEPESAGFGNMREIRGLLDECVTEACRGVISIPEAFGAGTQHHDAFDLALAINVVEHVPRPGRLIADVTQCLTRNGRGRFICPNYAFPYEPHFNRPTLLNKSATRRLLRRRIATSDIADSERFWEDLSWPTVKSLSRDLEQRRVSFRFSRSALNSYVDRLGDSSFTQRKGGVFTKMAGLARPVLAIGMRNIPIAVAPIIDLTTWLPGQIAGSTTTKL